MFILLGINNYETTVRSEPNYSTTPSCFAVKKENIWLKNMQLIKTPFTWYRIRMVTTSY